jgi:signal transduction histidine kinase
MTRRKWPVLLAILFLAQLVWYLLYTDRIVQALRANAEDVSEIYARVQAGIQDPAPGAAEEALFGLQGVIRESGVPLVLTGPGDTVLAAANLPFEADPAIPLGQERIREFTRRLDLRNPPMGDSALTLIHFGDPPAVRGLRWIPWLQAGGLLLTAVLGFLLIRMQRRAEAEKAWTAMARELAHQLGTPISSLQGWLELLSLPSPERPEGLGEGEVAREIGADLRRLERISHRFELIGREPELREVRLGDLISSLHGYIDARLPRLAAGVDLQIQVPEDLPPILGNEVLLTWALENVVKNSLDALAGRGGVIRMEARKEKDRVTLMISDTGPGVPPEVRGELFEPGVTTKPYGWGVGLALSRRIVEGVHQGRIELAEDGGPGATFHIVLPAAESAG